MFVKIDNITFEFKGYSFYEETFDKKSRLQDTLVIEFPLTEKFKRNNIKKYFTLEEGNYVLNYIDKSLERGIHFLDLSKFITSAKESLIKELPLYDYMDKLQKSNSLFCTFDE